MRLRKLEKRDAALMLEWMHDPSVVENLQADFASKTIGDCERFIEEAVDERSYLHLAIADETDTYMGTVSLKHITDDCAEFAITIRREAMGKGVSKYGMAEIIRIGLEEKKLRRIYWCVDPVNHRAVRFYDKNGYERIDLGQDEGLLQHIMDQGGYSEDQIRTFIWYQCM